MRSVLLHLFFIHIVLLSPNIVLSQTTLSVCETNKMMEPIITSTDVDSSIILLKNQNKIMGECCLQLLFRAASSNVYFTDKNISELTKIAKYDKDSLIIIEVVKVLWQVVSNREKNKLSSRGEKNIRDMAINIINYNKQGKLYSIYALIALGGDMRVEADLINIITEKPNREIKDVQLAAARCLGIMESDKAVKPLSVSLIKLYNNLNPQLEEKEYYIEGSIPYIELYKYTYINTVALFGQKAVNIIKPLIYDNNPEIKYLGAVILGKMGDKTIVPILCESLLNNISLYERERAANILGNLGDSSAIPVLSKAYDMYIKVPGPSIEHNIGVAAGQSLRKLKME